ncbi:hypothetical protein SAMN02745148_02035 [Modicisalibacter ilicicola DSM 19980]|uniref:DUF1127 domain-containing protein n=1 Tax=Modicisalibacter ilicicola DSM 19980 TaxID=1121942 RepID=A0A1M4ZS00_9GAMM|nr:hypothetical protein [Halomonas ilicicola]SHF20819.1 hypothetical protein SAMN02745148_02035 [Halomonas ilicicola DSM 19980]
MSNLKLLDRLQCEVKQPARPPLPRQPIREFYMPAMPPMGLINAVETWVRALVRRQRFRRRFLPLLDHDDHILDDMGHNREDIEWAARLPWREDAFKALQRRRAQRLKPR